MTTSHHTIHDSETVGAYFWRRRLTTLGYEEDLATALDEALRQPDFLVRLARYGPMNEELMHRILHDPQALSVARHAFATMPPMNEPRPKVHHVLCRQDIPDYAQGAERAEWLRRCPVVHLRGMGDDNQMMKAFARALPDRHAQAVAIFEVESAEFILRRLRILEHDPAAVHAMVRRWESLLHGRELS
jgi:hypothetical protein